MVQAKQLDEYQRILLPQETRLFTFQNTLLRAAEGVPCGALLTMRLLVHLLVNYSKVGTVQNGPPSVHHAGMDHVFSETRNRIGDLAYPGVSNRRSGTVNPWALQLVIIWLVIFANKLVMRSSAVAMGRSNTFKHREALLLIRHLRPHGLFASGN